ncbi:hypothetical protein ACTFIT_008012 [Dictyostelium discoideum]
MLMKLIKLSTISNNNNNNNSNNNNNNNNNQLILKSLPFDQINKIKLNKELNQYIDYNYILFKKVWGNIVIRKIILFHLRLYNINNCTIEFTLNGLSTYKYRNYLSKIILE